MSGLVTILFTDLVGSTAHASTVGDPAADEMRRDHFASLREAVVATGGTEVKTIGDALMVSYPGAADALTGAATMQTLGRPDDADRHSADAIALCERAGARAYLARAHFDRGTALADRGDPAGARPHLETAVAIGEDVGMTGPFGVVARGRDLFASLDAGQVDATTLLGLDLLVDASRPEVDAFAAMLDRAEYTTGDVIFTEGEVGRTFVILLDGEVVASRASRSRPDHRIELGTGGSGAIFGELATVTGEPRRASVTATSAVTAARGDVAAFDALVAIPGVMDRLVDLSTQRLAEIARPVGARLRDGTEVWLRPLVARDRDQFSAAIARQTDEWRHRRFFTAVKPGPALIDYLTHLDYLGHFAWAVGAPHPVDGIGTARFIRSHDDPTTAELAFEVADEWRGRGIATLLLGALGAAATHVGITTFRAEVLYENRPMRAVMNKAGAHWEHAETGVMETAFAVDATRPLLPADQWDALGTVTDEIVEVAGLALWRGATG